MDAPRRTPSLFLALTLCLACGRATPDATAVARVQIQAVIDSIVAATSTQNIDVYMALVPADFILHNESGGLVNREQLRANVLRDWSIIPATRSSWRRIDSLSVHGDSATVYTSQKWDRLMFERDHRTVDTVVTTQSHREHWRRSAGVWRAAAIDELGGSVMVNGKPYPR